MFRVSNMELKVCVQTGLPQAAPPTGPVLVIDEHCSVVLVLSLTLPRSWLAV